MIVARIFLYFTHIYAALHLSRYVVEYHPERRNKRGHVMEKAHLFFSPEDVENEYLCFNIGIEQLRELVKFVEIAEKLAEQ